jgi:hypothetical protein
VALSPAEREAICTRMAAGAALSTAAREAGVTPSRAQRTRRKGERDLAESRDTPDARFAAEVARIRDELGHRQSGRGPQADPAMTPEMREVLDHMEQGVGFTRACRLAEVEPAIAQRWRSRGRDLPGSGQSKFALAVDRLHAERVARAERLCASVIHSPPEDLQTKDRLAQARWTLSRLARGEYGDQIEVHVRSRLETLLTDVREYMSRAAYAELVHAIARLSGLDPSSDAGDSADGSGDPERLH